MREPQRDRQTSGLRCLARSEAQAFVGLVGRGVMTVEEALNALGIQPVERTKLEDFAAQQGGFVGRDIRKAIRLREMAVAEFQSLISSALAGCGQAA